MQVEIDALKPGVVQKREPAKPQRQTYYARRYGQQAYGTGSRLIGSLQVSEQTAAPLLHTFNRARAVGSPSRGGGGQAGTLRDFNIFLPCFTTILQIYCKAAWLGKSAECHCQSYVFVCLRTVLSAQQAVACKCGTGCMKPSGAAVQCCNAFCILYQLGLFFIRSSDGMLDSGSEPLRWDVRWHCEHPWQHDKGHVHCVATDSCVPKRQSTVRTIQHHDTPTGRAQIC